MKKTSATSLLLFLLIIVTTFCLTEAAIADDWPMFQHDAAHSGYSDTNMQVAPVSAWNFTGKSDLSIAAVVDGVAYCTSDGFLKNEMYAINTATGQLIWNNSYYISDYASLFCPAVSDGIVYTLTTAYDASNGNFLFNYTNVNASTSPTVANGMVYFGTDIGKFLAPGGVVAIDAKTGQTVWTFTSANSAFIYGGMVHYPPAVENGVVYFSCGDGVYALNALNGAVLWHNSDIDKSGGSLGCISVADGQVYNNVGGNLSSMNAHGSSWWAAISRGNRFAVIENGVVYINSLALDASSGRLIWNNSLTELSSPALMDGVIFYTHSWYSDEGYRGHWHQHGVVGCNAATGEKVWEFTSPGFFDEMSIGYVSIANGMLFYSDESTMYAFSLKPISQFNLQSDTTSYALIAVAITVTVIVLVILISVKKTRLINR